MKFSIGFIGLGYVGLTSAICFASKGYEVYGYDVDKEKINLINNGILPIYEKDLDIYFEKVKNKNFIVTSDILDTIKNSNIIFITVGTPSNPDGSLNTKYIEDASKSIAISLKKIKEYKLIVVKSTVLPTTTENIVLKILEKESGLKCFEEFGLCVNPEFLREGEAVYDTFNPDRIIIGEEKKEDGDILINFYKDFYKENLPPILRTNFVNAELIKYVNNSFLAMKISFINMIANLCQKIKGADVEVVAKGIGLDKRIGSLFLKAGLGWGGSCFPKDLLAFNYFGKKLNVDFSLIEDTISINEKQPLKAIEICKEVLKDLKGKTISLLGLSFKPNTDDIRNAVSLKIINELIKEEAFIKVYDPKAMDNIKKIYQDRLYYSKNIYDCIYNSDCVIIITEWDEFKKLTYKDFIKYMRFPFIIDGRRLYNPKDFSDKLIYKAIGLNID